VRKPSPNCPKSTICNTGHKLVSPPFYGAEMSPIQPESGLLTATKLLCAAYAAIAVVALAAIGLAVWVDVG
jgi:hypothetical protein